MRTLLSSLLVLSLTLGPLVGCTTTNPATGKQSFTAFMSPEDELKVGAEEHPKILAQHGGVYEYKALNAYVAQIGGKLAKASEMPDLDFRFTLVNDEAVNAFALPGGYIYVTRGLVSLAENEAELAGVLAHEIGHVTARHTAERYSKAQATNIGLTLFGIIGGAFGVPSAVSQVAGVGAQAWLQGFSREQELEADQLGVRYMTRVGYDPKGLETFFRKLRAEHEFRGKLMGKDTDPDAHNIMATHPRTIDRIEQAIQLANETKLTDPVLGRAPFLKAIDGMVYGDDPSQGIRRGRNFIHPDLGFTFTVPAGFRLINSPHQVAAMDDSGAVILFDLANPKESDPFADLADYIQRGWAKNVPLEGLERIEVNGMRAATATTTRRTNQGTQDVRLVAIRMSQAFVYRFMFVTPQNRTQALATELQRTTYSFRRITEAERQAVRPLRIGLHTVRRGDTIADLAAKLPFESLREERLRLINGLLEPGDQLKAGTTIKTIRD